jgi:signal transduction histidine kinase
MMFKQLRNRVLLWNTLLTSLVIILALFVIYLITASSVNADNQRRIDELVNLTTDMPVEELRETEISGAMTHGYLLFFTVALDAKGEVIFAHVEGDEHTACVDLAETAWQNGKTGGLIREGEHLWQYTLRPYASLNVSAHTREEDTVYWVTFLDVADSHRTLNILLISFAGAGLLLLAIVFVISLLLTNHSIQPLARLWQKRREFMADASHELKTPLSIINANYDAIVENQAETVASQMKWLQNIKQGADRMTGLIGSLLALANSEDLGNKVSVEFSVSDLLQETIATMEALLQKKSLHLQQKIEPGVQAVSDCRSVRDIFTALLDNAIKYTEPGGQIKITLSKERRWIICTFANSGRGIATRDLPHVFDRFFRSELAPHEETSYGLGLSIAKSCADKIGARLFVESRQLQETTFTLSLPEESPFSGFQNKY